MDPASGGVAGAPRWAGPFDPADRERINEHIAAWARFLGLNDWTIAYAPIPPPTPEHRASSDTDVIYQRAVVRLHPGSPPSQVDRLIVHELLHILTALMEDTFRRASSGLGEAERAFLMGQWERSQEWALERLAGLITGVGWQAFHDDEVWTVAFPLPDGPDEPIEPAAD